MTQEAHTEEEHAEMVASLKLAEARIAAGQYAEHDPTTFVDRLMHARADAIRDDSIPLDDETASAIDEGLADAKRGDSASAAEVAALWKSHGL